MNIRHAVFFCALSALCSGNTGLVSAKRNIYTGPEGGTGIINCHISLVGNVKFFCKDECKAEDILIKTEDVRAQSGRYSSEYKNDSNDGVGILAVTIRNLTKSDAGRYRCGLGKTLVPVLYWDFEVRVSDDALLSGNSGFIHSDIEGEDITYPCSYTVYGSHKFFCKDECKKQEDILVETDGNRAQSGRYTIEYKQGSLFGLYLTIRQATKSDTGRYRCGYGRALSPDSFRKFTIIVIDADPSASVPTTQSSVSLEASDQLTASSEVSGHFWPLAVCVSLVVVFLLAVILLLLYIWKTRRNFNSNRGDMFPVIYKELSPASTCEDSTYNSGRN
ncbi:polymeric immunoglobulin receptor-like isoform X2 [Plectropomus leopardus]|uniref:polymeric immunoglobulin receptor-like isoform X2 n=1 Tax=Plectropomus leopardus TaxID=160734 RepID=UPI001C4D64A6|nr:polymeric immunoglobulin receptor-like isoform X2 [Plectropomus leopardus]